MVITSVNSHVQLKLELADGGPLAAGCTVLDAGSRVAEAVDAGSLWVREYRCATRHAAAPRRAGASWPGEGLCMPRPGGSLPRAGRRLPRRAAR
jgi:hypothetical protein